MEAVVHPTNATFSISGEVGSALSKVGGDDFVKAVEASHEGHGDLEMSEGILLEVIFCDRKILSSLHLS